MELQTSYLLFLSLNIPYLKEDTFFNKVDTFSVRDSLNALIKVFIPECYIIFRKTPDIENLIKNNILSLELSYSNYISGYSNITNEDLKNYLFLQWVFLLEEMKRYIKIVYYFIILFQLLLFFLLPLQEELPLKYLMN